MRQVIRDIWLVIRKQLILASQVQIPNFWRLEMSSFYYDKCKCSSTGLCLKITTTFFNFLDLHRSDEGRVEEAVDWELYFTIKL